MNVCLSFSKERNLTITVCVRGGNKERIMIVFDDKSIIHKEKKRIFPPFPRIDIFKDLRLCVNIVFSYLSMQK